MSVRVQSVRKRRAMTPQDPRVRQKLNEELELSISLRTGEEERRRVARATAEDGKWGEINRLAREAAGLRAEIARLRGCLAEAIALVASLRAAAAPVRKPACKAVVAGKARRASA